MTQKPTLTLVSVGPKGLTLKQTLELFSRLSGREATPDEIAKLKPRMAERELRHSEQAKRS